MELISIIVPVYNVQPYIHRCINSLQQQTYSNIEIILVNDGSTDNCPQICNAFANADCRIKVIHKENGGLSDARNAGLLEAKGEVIAFVDSDDWVSPYYIEVMYDVMQRQLADIVECDVIRSDGNPMSLDFSDSHEVTKYNTSEALKLLITDTVFHQYVWNKLYKRDVIRKILFEYGKCNEDEFWTYQVFGNATRIVKVSTPLYYYFQRPESIMGQGYKLNRLDAVEAKIIRQKYIEINFPELSDCAGTNLFGSMIYAGQMSIRHLSKEDCSKALAILKRDFLAEIKSRHIQWVGSFGNKLWLCLSRVSFVGTCYLRNVLNRGVE